MVFLEIVVIGDQLGLLVDQEHLECQDTKGTLVIKVRKVKLDQLDFLGRRGQGVTLDQSVCRDCGVRKVIKDYRLWYV